MPSILRDIGEHYSDDDVRCFSATFLGSSATFDRPVFIAPSDGRVTGAWLSSDTTITADDIGNWAFNVQNGATECMVERITTIAGGTITANTPVELTASATTTNRNFSRGDDLMLFGTAAGAATSLAAAYLNVSIAWVAR